MQTLNALLQPFASHVLFRRTHPQPLKYQCASLADGETIPHPNVLYICPQDHIPEQLLQFPFCGCVILADSGLQPPDAQCELCACALDLDAGTLLCRLQEALLQGLEQNRLHLLQNDLTLGQKNVRLFIQNACEIMGNPVAMFDPYQRVIAMESFGRPVDSPIWVQAWDKGFLSPEEAKISREAVGGVSITESPCLCTTYAWERTHCLVMHVTGKDGAVLGCIAAYETFRPFRPEDCDLLTQLCRLAAQLLDKDPADDPVTVRRDTYLTDLLMGLSVDHSAMEQTLADLNWPAFSLYQAAFVRLEDNPTLQRQSGYFCKVLSACGQNIIALPYSGNIALLLCAQDYEDLSEYTKKLRIQLQLQELNAGTSTVFSDLSQLRGAVETAKRVLSLGLRITGQKPLYSPQEVGIYRLLSELPPEQLQNCYRMTFHARIAEFDRRKQTDYCSTLVAYIKNTFKTVQTANELFIHKNSLLYRLGRFEPLFGLDPNRVEDVMDFWLGYQLNEYLQYLKRQIPEN